MRCVACAEKESDTRIPDGVAGQSSPSPHTTNTRFEEAHGVVYVSRIGSKKMAKRYGMGECTGKRNGKEAEEMTPPALPKVFPLEESVDERETVEGTWNETWSH